MRANSEVDRTLFKLYYNTAMYPYSIKYEMKDGSKQSDSAILEPSSNTFWRIQLHPSYSSISFSGAVSRFLMRSTTVFASTGISPTGYSSASCHQWNQLGS